MPNTRLNTTTTTTPPKATEKIPHACVCIIPCALQLEYATLSRSMLSCARGKTRVSPRGTRLRTSLRANHVQTRNPNRRRRRRRRAKATGAGYTSYGCDAEQNRTAHRRRFLASLRNILMRARRRLTCICRIYSRISHVHVRIEACIHAYIIHKMYVQARILVVGWLERVLCKICYIVCWRPDARPLFARTRLRHCFAFCICVCICVCVSCGTPRGARTWKLCLLDVLP